MFNELHTVGCIFESAPDASTFFVGLSFNLGSRLLTFTGSSRGTLTTNPRQLKPLLFLTFSSFCSGDLFLSQLNRDVWVSETSRVSAVLTRTPRMIVNTPTRRGSPTARAVPRAVGTGFNFVGATENVCDLNLCATHVVKNVTDATDRQGLTTPRRSAAV